MSRYTIGERVLIVEDCRRDAQGIRQGIATGQTGIYEGRFDAPSGCFESPRIRLQDGSVIWGYQCWWNPVQTAGPLPQEQVKLEKTKEFLREVLADLENSP